MKLQRSKMVYVLIVQRKDKILESNSKINGIFSKKKILFDTKEGKIGNWKCLFLGVSFF